MRTSVTQQRTATDSIGILVGLVMAVSSALIPNLDTGSAEATPPAAITASPTAEPAPFELTALLSQLSIAPEEARSGYDRDLFKHWIDADGNGCDTREEVLIEESLVPVEPGPGCAIAEGQWLSLYDAVAFTDPRGMDIDHMVPLGEAWDSGASSWDSLRRQAYANDLDHPEALIAVSASSNRSKSDRDPAEWTPPNPEISCRYATDWITVKVTWELTADAAEVEGLHELLATCEIDAG